MSGVTRVAVVGLGKIAQDQHLPAIAGSRQFELVAAASPAGVARGVPVFEDVEQLLASPIRIDALALCQPPQFRFAAAARALRAGKHVLLEKPPGATCLEVEALERLATEARTTLFSAWHSRFAPAVRPACAWLATRHIRSIEIQWQEDVRQWHPGQEWIWQPGGLGVFDPGINALSILTRLVSEPLLVQGGTLEVPGNRAVPIGAQLQMATLSGIPVSATFDWRQRGAPSWDITVLTDEATLRLSAGGATLHIADRPIEVPATDEYPAVYEHFAALLAQGASDVDALPLRLVADAFMICSQRPVAPFYEDS